MPTPLTIELERDRTAPAAARRAVERLGLSDPLMAETRLLVSELISNAVKYGADGPVQLLLRSEAPGHVHAEVVDQGASFVPTLRDRPKTEVGGWGLHLVDALAQRWGVREGTPRIWFEIDRR